MWSLYGRATAKLCGGRHNHTHNAAVDRGARRLDTCICLPGLFRSQPKMTAAEVARFIRGRMVPGLLGVAAGIIGIHGLVTGNTFMPVEDGPSYWANRAKDSFFYWAAVSLELVISVAVLAVLAWDFRCNESRRTSSPSRNARQPKPTGAICGCYGACAGDKRLNRVGAFSLEQKRQPPPGPPQ